MAKKPTYEELEQRIKELGNEAFERKKTEEALRESESKYRTLVEQLPSAIYIAAIDEASTTLFISPQVEEILGFRPDEWKKDNDIWLIQIHPDDRERVLAEVEASHKIGGSFLSEYRMTTRDGRTIWIRDQAKIVQDDEGRPLFLQGMMSDITDLKQAQEALRESEEKYRNIFENVQDVYYEVTLDGIILEISPSIKDVSRYKRAELIGKSLYDIYIDPRNRDKFVKELLKNGNVTDYEILLKDKDGSQLYCSITAKLVSDKHGNPAKIIGSMHNITERKLAEKELRHSEAQKKAILDASIDSLRYVDKDMKIIWANKTAALGVDMSPEELVGQACHKVFTDRETPCEGCPTVRARETGKIERAVMYQPKAKGVAGGSYWDNYSVPLKNIGGDIVSFIQIARNITDEKQAMDALRESEETLDAINASSPVGIALVRKRILDWTNKAMYHMLGYEEGSLLEETARVLYPNDEEYDRVGRILYPGIGETGMGQTETRLVKKDGGIIHCYIQMCALNPSDPDKGVIVAVMDITDRKLAEEHIHTLTQQLMQAQENERQMISRELHDRVGQDLSTLRIGLDTLIDNQPGVLPETRQRVSELSKMLQDSIMVIRDLSYDLRPPSLDQLGLVRTILQYAHDFSEKTGLSVDFTSAGMDHLRLDFDTDINLYRLVQEGLMNIQKHADARHVSIRLVASYPNIILRIEDDGKGFDVKERLVTALNEKRMGLRSMEERVNLLEGKIRIQSRPGKGTKVLIEVPYEEKKSES
jgi:PAS domain S-box-containing protein